MAKYKVLSTKKLEPSLIQQAEENGIEIIEQEFISIRTIKDLETFGQICTCLKKPYAAFTSANAVIAFEPYIHPNVEDDLTYMPEWKIFCLQGKTKEALLNVKHLNKKIIAQAENATDLAKKIIELKVQEIVFFCGNKRREELPSILKKAEIKVHEVVVYETIKTPVATTNDFDAILFFSPSAVQSFFSINQLNKDVVCFAVGNTTANSIQHFANNKIIICEQPSQEMMLASVQFHLKNNNCNE